MGIKMNACAWKERSWEVYGITKDLLDQVEFVLSPSVDFESAPNRLTDMQHQHDSGIIYLYFWSQ